MQGGLKIDRPKPREYDSFYEGYVSRISGPVFNSLESQVSEFSALVAGLSEKDLDHRYEVGKWSIAEVLGHICDVERMFGFRLMSIARGDQQALPGFDQGAYVKNGQFQTRPKESFDQEFSGLRSANLALISSFDDTSIDITGNANGANITARALVYILAGHVDHHLSILKERYLN